MKRQYEFFAIFTPNSSGGYGVCLPNLPGTLSGGDDDADALESGSGMSRIALGRALGRRPAPTPADRLEDELTPGERSRTPQGNATQNLVIRVTPEENERLAELARRAGTTKSDVRALVAAQD